MLFPSKLLIYTLKEKKKKPLYVQGKRPKEKYDPSCY